MKKDENYYIGLTKLYSNLEKLSKDKLYIESSELNTQIMSYISRLMYESDYDLCSGSEIDFTSLLKLCDVKFASDSASSLCNRIIGYLRAYTELLKTKLFVFVNLKSFINKLDLVELLKTAAYCKYSILLLENVQREVKLENEVIRIIDNDLCEIY